MGGNYKSLLIEDPADLQALLAALHIQREEYYGVRPVLGLSQPLTIGFHFPGGQSRNHTLETPYQMSGYQVDRAFYDQLNEIVSREEGRRVDILQQAPTNGPVGGQIMNGNGDE